jgi:hypothetical protein
MRRTVFASLLCITACSTKYAPVAPPLMVYVLHYIGEGNDLLWFKGREFAEQLHTDKPGPIEYWKGLELLETPTTEWWVRMKNSAGKVGWTTRAGDFDGADACE